jgi:hypothetical protein
MNLYEKETYWIGDSIFDRDNGVSYPSGVEIIQSIRVETDGGTEFIQNIVNKYLDNDYTYTNKMAVVIGEDERGDKIVAWSYDGRTLTTQVVKGLR